MANTLDLNAAALDIVKAANAADATFTGGGAMLNVAAAAVVAPGAPAAPAAALNPTAFCALWKEAKPVLQAALLILFVAPRIKAVVQKLIDIGDKIAAAVGCT